MRLRYFAWVRDRLGQGEEDFTLPEDITTVAGLLAFLKTRGEPYSLVFEEEANLKVAVNLVYAKPETPLAPDDEVAIFPPVTGG